MELQQLWPGPYPLYQALQTPALEGWRLTFLGERKQGIFPGGSAVTKRESRRGQQGGPDHSPSLLRTAGFLPMGSPTEKPCHLGWEG